MISQYNNLFGLEPYKITKPIRLIELFGGIGAQAKALENLNVNFEHYRLCEFDKYAIASYNAVHHTAFETSDITKIEAQDLGIVDTDKYDYIMCYSFPCITKDSLILTEKGYIPYSDVKVGMKVLTKSNTWQKVAKLFDNGVHQTYYLQGMGFENIHCTANHKFYVREKYKKGHKSIRCFKDPIFKEVKDLNRNDYFGVPVINTEEPFYTDSLDFWFLIGMYLGDGWLPKQNNDIIIACNDVKLKMLQDRLSFDKYHYTINDLDKSSHKFRFANKEIKEFIKTYIGSGCENKHIPYEIINLPKKQLQEFYNGYLASDGCVINGKHQFTSINRNIIYSISCIINKLYERPTSIYKIKTKKQKVIKGRIVNQKDWFQLRFNPNTNKQDRAFYENGYIWYPFSKLEKAEEEHVYNMEIENDHSYIIQGCISKNCQDLSLAGLTKGMKKGSSTRSGLLWEVERLLKGCKELPQVLVMENVTQVHNEKNKHDFEDWCKFLNSLGYLNYYNDMNAKNYGIPQNRDRTIMVSVLGNYDYTFPKKEQLKLRLKDLLESNVDEKYFLSDKMINYISSTGTANFHNSDSRINLDIARPITTAPNKRAGTTNYISKDVGDNYDLKTNKIIEEYNLYDLGIKRYNRRTGSVVNPKGISSTLLARGDNNLVLADKPSISINEATKKGYAEAYEGDGVYINRPHQKRGVVQHDMIQTIKTSCNDIGVVVKDDTLKRELCNKLIEDGNVEEGGVVKHSYTQQILDGKRRCLEKSDGIMITLTTRPDTIGVVVKDKYMGTYEYSKSSSFIGNDENNRIKLNNDISYTILASGNNNKAILKDKEISPCETSLRIRKLTPKECWRLMGFSDNDFAAASKVCSDAQLYKQAGNSIVVNVLMEVFKQLL